MEDLAGLVDVVGHPQELEIGEADVARGGDRPAQPVEQPAPVLGAEEDDREVLDLAGLDEGERLEQLVEGAEAAGEDDEALRRT